MAIEDKRFYQHGGRPEGIVRAVFDRVALGRREGGSTITQQLIKNTYLTCEQTSGGSSRRSCSRTSSSRSGSKPRILASYLNTIYFGHDSYGVDAAARYLLREAREATLGIPEAALLAASQVAERVRPARPPLRGPRAAATS